MTSQLPQQMPAPQPVVLVVNQPTIMDPREQQCYSRQPYLNRGAQFSNGCRCYLPQIILLCSLGFFILFIGLSTVSIGIPSGILLLFMGGILLGLGIYIVRAAKTQFNSLPPDHPDRTKYAVRSLFPTPGSSDTPAVYTVPPMQNQVMSYPSTTGGQVYLLPAGSCVPTSSGVEGVQVQFVAPQGRPSRQGTYTPENDPPPAYSDVVHNI